MKARRRRLDVQADLVVSHTAGDMTITGHGDRLRIDLASLRLGRELARAASAQADRPRRESLDRALRGTGLVVEIAVRDRTIGRLGTGARAGWLDRRLNLAPAQFDYSALWRSLLRG